MGFDYNEFKIIENDFPKDSIRLSESIMSMGNEYMGMRGNFEETYTGDSMQGSYIGGVWMPDKTKVGWWKNGYPNYFGKMINSTNYIGIKVFIDGVELDLNDEKIVEYKRELDMKEGSLKRTFIINRDENKYSFNITRFLSIVKKEICAIRFEMKSLDKDSHIKLVPYLDADVHNEDSNYEECFWDVIDKETSQTGSYIVSKTVENDFDVERFSVCHYMKTKLEQNSDLEKFGVENSTLQKSTRTEKKYVEASFDFTLSKGENVVLDKFISVTTTRDMKENDLEPNAKRLINDAYELGFEKLYEENKKAWEKRWDLADIKIDADVKYQQGIRFNLFQMFCTYYGDDSRLNVGPKGFTGEKYGGATYWDTEAYIVPMYLAIAPKEVTKSLLKYRYNQLNEAKHNASQQGLDGALYPMVTFNGVECHNEWEITFEEIHRNGAIAHAIYNYTNYTGDESYLKEFGIEVLVEISRFWADRVHFSKNKKKYMIHGVTGPNEYENNVNNNWYTNKLATWVLKYTLECIEKIGLKQVVNTIEFNNINNKSDVKNRKLEKIELKKWSDIVENMYLPYDENRQIFVQHDTFLDKDLMKVSELDKSQRPLNQKWSWDRILRSCFIKQADVLQGIYFFNDEFTMAEKRRNYEFYEPMTVHESSLSPCIHSILASELGMMDKAIEMYERTARLDLDNYNNDTEDGLHITSMSGSWLAIVQGFAGMRTDGEILSFYPRLPEKWNGYSFKINYRGRLLYIQISEEEVSIDKLSGESIDIDVYGVIQTLD